MNPINYAGIAVIAVLLGAVVVLLLKRKEGSRRAVEAQEEARAIINMAREVGV